MFGDAVAIDDDLLLVGASFSRGFDSSLPAGSVYVFRNSSHGWVNEATLTQGDPEQGDTFGGAVALDGGVAVIGARFDDDLGRASGSAYVFERTHTGWIQSAKLLAPDGETNDRFGWAVGISGDTIAVGAPFDGDNGPASGSVSLFRRAGRTWDFEAKLTASDADEFDFFGSAVAIHDATLVVGSPRFIVNGGSLNEDGAAFVFTRQSGAWKEAALLRASDSAIENRFGESVATDGRSIVVGATRLTLDPQSPPGAAYVFRRLGNRWGEEAKISATDGASADGFGAAVAVSHRDLYVGAPWRGDGAAFVGGLSHFQRIGRRWIDRGRLDNPGRASGEQLGHSVAAQNRTVVAGAIRFRSNVLHDTGAAHVFELQGRSSRRHKCPDLTGDGRVDGRDLGDLLARWGQSGRTDIDHDGITGSSDLAALLAAWTESN